jgi:hypothetical protein
VVGFSAALPPEVLPSNGDDQAASVAHADNKPR